MAKTFKVGIEVGGVCHFFDATQPKNVKVGDRTTDEKYEVLALKKGPNGQILAELSGLPKTHRITRIQLFESNAKSR